MNLVPSIALSILSFNTLVIMFLSAPIHIKYRRTMVDYFVHVEGSPEGKGKVLATRIKSGYLSIHLIILFFLIDAAYSSFYNSGPDYYDALRSVGNAYLYAFTLYSFALLVALQFIVLRMGILGLGFIV